MSEQDPDAWWSATEKTIGELRDSEDRLCCATRAEFSLISHEEAKAAFERRAAAEGE